MNAFTETLVDAFGRDRVVRDAPLASLTTFRVGGPADWLVTVRTTDEIVRAAALARAAGVPLTVLGGGSNVLIADAGIRGLVLRIHGGGIVQVNGTSIMADAGVTINGLVRWTVSRGIAGLEAWAGTPGTVGGAIHGNAHFQGRLISELVASVDLLTREGVPLHVPAAAMEFGYDASRVQRTREIVVAATFRTSAGDPERLRLTARESLAFRKRTQPLEKSSAGCVFQNPDPARETLPAGVPASAGALIDRAGLKDAGVGAARVSARHANFIVHDGGASADEIASLIERCRQQVRDRFGVTLRDEIVRLGFGEGRDVDSED